MRYSSFYTVALLCQITFAKQGSNFNVASEFANDNGCGTLCQQILNKTNAIDLDALGHAFDFDFYATAKTFTGSKPGDLLKVQPLDPKTLNVRAGTTVYRLQYTSLDLDGKSTVPVTGFVAFPYAPLGTSSDQKFRSVAYAHGSIGLYRGCAPSNGPALWDYDSWKLLVDRGYAVIATDYAGLGNNDTLHKYCSFPAHANDLYYSVIAARKAFGSVLSKEWMSVGHSQGGGAVWKLAESDLIKHDSTNRYLGTVALAPATYVVDMAIAGLASVVEGENAASVAALVGYAPYLALALQRAQPSYDLAVLSPTMRKRIAVANQAQTCTTALMGLTIDLKATDIISQQGIAKDAERFLQWQGQMAPALGDHSPAPILVVQGQNDTSILPNITRQAYERSCQSGNQVHLSSYPGADHSAVIAASAPEWLAWMDNKFTGQLAQGCCSSATRKPFDGGKHMKLPVEFDTSQILPKI